MFREFLLKIQDGGLESKFSRIIKFFALQCSDIPNLVTQVEWHKSDLQYLFYMITKVGSPSHYYIPSHYILVKLYCNLSINRFNTI